LEFADPESPNRPITDLLSGFDGRWGIEEIGRIARKHL